ncbi:sensor histidine kinase [Defluviitalea raffinosedens]|uniref:sensor histidine kinase n=1 Tax=Defluviitalea raffinosedens TaxID=1450156 RepID=UPI00195640F3|nr:HAMP domain-containing sensor histidine kinase [Defluviitalea raffinosedens]MBM7686225.1 signal transduction histidine kinase [Defluviitalea raffinosedens]
MELAYRFFRKYFISTIFLLLFFLLFNMLLIIGVLLFANINSNHLEMPVKTISNLISVNDKGDIYSEDAVGKLLDQKQAWAMLLNDYGTVIWQYNMPSHLPKQYSSTDIAKFSRWYLNEYPTYVYEHSAGLLVIGCAPESIVKWNYSMNTKYTSLMLAGCVIIVIANVFLMLLLFWQNTQRVEKAITPILQGIEKISNGQEVSLPEKGELAEINHKLNNAGYHLLKKEQARAEWINGISHDIRTPLSIMLGYAGEIEDSDGVPEEIRKQACIIRQQGMKLRQLITDLNLVSKLEYSMQPLHLCTIDPVELTRQILVGYTENGLNEKYTLKLEANQNEIPGIQGDASLIARMLENLIQNSIKHNQEGCHIVISIQSGEGKCIINVSDDGKGATESKLMQLNRGTILEETYEVNSETPHGLDLRLVHQIVKAHNGVIQFSNRNPHGFSVTIEFPARHE